MGVIAYTEADVKLLARLLRAEAEGEGNLGMLMVGNVGVNRVLGNCLDFKDITSIRQMVFQNPGGFEATQKGYFYQAARSNELNLARRALKGERQHPASNALWFLDQVAIVQHNGITNGIQVGSNHTVSTSLPNQIAHLFINLFGGKCNDSTRLSLLWWESPTTTTAIQQPISAAASTEFQHSTTFSKHTNTRDANKRSRSINRSTANGTILY